MVLGSQAGQDAHGVEVSLVCWDTMLVIPCPESQPEHAKQVERRFIGEWESGAINSAPASHLGMKSRKGRTKFGTTSRHVESAVI